MDIGSFKDYLAKGAVCSAGFRIPRLPSVAQDGADAEDNSKVAKTFLKKTLMEHDKVYHKDGYDPQKDKCNFREMLKKNDNVDALVEEKPQESVKLGLVEFIEGKDGEKKLVDIVEVEEARSEIQEAVAEDSVEKYLAMSAEDSQ